MHSVTISLGDNRFLALNDEDKGLYIIEQNSRGQLLNKMYLCEATKGAASAVQDYIERMKTFLS